MSKDKKTAVASEETKTPEAVESASTLEPVGVEEETPVNEAALDDTEKYRLELEKAKKYIMKIDGANKNLKKELNEYATQSTVDVVQADNDHIVATMEDMFDRKFRQFQAVQDKQIYEEALHTISRHNDERDAIDFHYKNSIRLTGDLKVDLTRAWNLANAHKIERAAQKRAGDAHHRSARKDDATALAGGKSAASNRGNSTDKEPVYTSAEQKLADFVKGEKNRMKNIAKSSSALVSRK